MRTLAIYLNELSCACNGLSRDAIRPHLVTTITTLRRVAEHRQDAVFRLHCRLAELTFGEQHLPLAAILPERNERFTQFKSLLARAPSGPVTALTSEIRCAGCTPIGLTWADSEDSLVFSLGHCSPWSEGAIPCERHTMDASANITERQVEVRNLAIAVHAQHWEEYILNYGKDASSSSVLYEGRGFFVRMHFHDHPPAHLHIYPRRGDTRDRIARVRIDNGDKMDGSLSSAMDHEVSEFITRNRTALLESWDRVQAGKLPLNVV